MIVLCITHCNYEVVLLTVDYTVVYAHVYCMHYCTVSDLLLASYLTHAAEHTVIH